MNTRHCSSAFTLAAALMIAPALFAQQPAPAPAPANSISCLPTGQPLPAIPEIAATPDPTDPTKHKLSGTMYTVNVQNRLVGGDGNCYAQWVRAYRKDAPTTWNPSSQTISDPQPGPTLRARVGDMIELTFLNSIDRGKFPNADKGCDQTSKYPGTGPGHDVYPDCFAESVMTNLHYHGTHTNPNSTGDNVFLTIEPSPRLHDGTNAPVVTAASVQSAFSDFFKQCEAQLMANDGPTIWPLLWKEIPQSLQDLEKNLLTQYRPDLWAQNQKLIDMGKWPQYFLGNYPYCFRLPQYTQTSWPPVSPAMASTPHSHGASMAEMPEPEAPTRPLLMGQSPGTHWYHAHKHGSTTINVMNGMTGVFVIEGPYDDEINAYYGAGWTRKQPVMVINQLGSFPKLMAGGAGGPRPAFSVNGRILPTISMPGNSVQMWRIASTSSRSGVQFLAPTGVSWMQLAQDGVQFNDSNYQQTKNISFLLASGNRADLLVKAPAYNPGGNNTYPVQVGETVDPSGVFTETLMNVVVTANGPTNMQFMPHAPSFPPFLADITDTEVKGTKTITFASTSNAAAPAPPAEHTIDGKKFDGEVGASVVLNKVEEWKIVNATYPVGGSGLISHPFHIHINPFQITAKLVPNQALSTTNGAGTVTVTSPSTGNMIVTGTGTSFTSSAHLGDWLSVNGKRGTILKIDSDTQVELANASFGAVSTATAYQIVVPLYTISTPRPGQCQIDPKDAKPCGQTEPSSNRIWWDVFPIPSGNTFYATTDSTGSNPINVPGWFTMRSRFVDYFGDFVMHCHILAHEDRGMMTVVEVTPLQTPYSHH